MWGDDLLKGEGRRIGQKGGGRQVLECDRLRLSKPCCGTAVRNLTRMLTACNWADDTSSDICHRVIEQRHHDRNKRSITVSSMRGISNINESKSAKHPCLAHAFRNKGTVPRRIFSLRILDWRTPSGSSSRCPDRTAAQVEWSCVRRRAVSSSCGERRQSPISIPVASIAGAWPPPPRCRVRPPFEPIG